MALRWHSPNFSQIAMDILYNPDNGAPFFDSILFREKAFFTFSFVLNNCPESTHADLVALKSKVVLSAYLQTPLVHDAAYEEAPGLVAPIYALDHLPPTFNLPLVGRRLGHANHNYNIYGVTWNFGDTVVHLALHPSGYDTVLYSVGFPPLNSTSLPPMPDLTPDLTQTALISLPSVMIVPSSSESSGRYPAVDRLRYDPLASATRAYSPAADSSESGFFGSFISSSILETSHNGTSAYLACGGDPNAHMPLTTQTTGAHRRRRNKTENTTLQVISNQYPNWGKALANLWCMIRAAVCCGDCSNLFLIVMSDYVTERKVLLNSLWPDALTRSNLQLQDLENANNTPMSEADILALGDAWFSLFMHDNKRLVTSTLKSNRSGFDLSAIFGTALISKVVSILSRLMPPQSNRLPLAENGLAWFLLHQVTKEFMYHVIFRHNSTRGNRICLADLRPAIFRHAASPPVTTLALAVTTCYAVLLNFLDIEVIDFYAFMTVKNFHAHMCQTIPMLFEQSNDSGHAAFMLAMKTLCDIRRGDVERVSRPKKKKAAA
ncbi:hypothetical protein DEU56DRAFT_915787 [Suillus clintonianus]|uniref:uncharacterized protein n=1 Tax=Suillus clintonianus TaxID=1904413 RepID=UPI001B868E14|nr:uncharacterized protein DEU56DRAFT_915787 [Suillus clintonianus]KAG2127244.1 hypothetical protein DEU56DRAFT_915787 [Suillus clintonianus]